MPIHGYPGNVITANPTAPTSSVASGVWTTEQQLIAKAAGNWPLPGPPQPISRSLRFNSADTAYLDRTLGTSNRRTFTFSAWLKRSVFASTQCIFGNINYAGGGSTNQQFYLGFTGSDQLDMFHYNNGTQNQVTSSAVYRDPSAWYHIVGAVDTTQATSSNRLKIYVNGSQITALATATYPAQNTDTFINANLSTGIGRQVGTGITGSYYNDGYLTEIYFIDGQALTPSSFGQTNSNTGVWEPIAYSGTYGTNGFYLNFSDNSNTTAATLGKDYSGNGNNWTPNNFSVTAGAGNDSMVDSPTSYGTDTGVGGEVRGNYATWNPLVLFPTTTYQSSITDGNLLMTRAGAGQGGAVTTIGVTTGKFYAEMPVIAVGTSITKLGVAATNNPPSLNAGSEYAVGDTSAGVVYRSNGARLTGGTTTASWGSTYTTNDVIGIAFDADSGKVWFAKNGTWQASGDPAAGTNPATTLSTGVPFYFTAGGEGGISIALNAGQRAFAYTAPSGFKALCTQNLPTPTIGATSTTQANDYFNVVLYSGNSSTQNITGVGFAPDFTWLKVRNDAQNHRLFDTVRGANKRLMSSSTQQEITTTDELTAFGSNGFTLGANTDVNGTGFTFVSWNWNAGGSNATNTAGTITSTVRANTTAGFSVVTYTGTGSNATVGHGIGTAPQMVICKNRSQASEWYVYHASLGTNKAIFLEQTAAASTSNLWWNNTAPTSTVFSLGDQTGNNGSGNSIVAYCFAPVAGYSAFGSYTGNGSTDGPFVYLGFRPEFVMIKNTTTAGTSWEMFDAAREPANLVDLELLANSSGAEGTYTFGDFVSNGFKLRSTNNGVNQSTATLVYMAFAENPFKYALAR